MQLSSFAASQSVQTWFKSTGPTINKSAWANGKKVGQLPPPRPLTSPFKPCFWFTGICGSQDNVLIHIYASLQSAVNLYAVCKYLGAVCQHHDKQYHADRAPVILYSRQHAQRHARAWGGNYEYQIPHFINMLTAQDSWKLRKSFKQWKGKNLKKLKHLKWDNHEKNINSDIEFISYRYLIVHNCPFKNDVQVEHLHACRADPSVPASRADLSLLWPPLLLAPFQGGEPWPLDGAPAWPKTSKQKQHASCNTPHAIHLNMLNLFKK